jgi:hypothetical protein
MPRTVLGQPVDEEKWAEAKKQAAEEGHAENYAYISAIYKQMAHLGKAADYRDSVTLTIECNRAAADELLPLLKELKTLGNIGASRSIVIEYRTGESKAQIGIEAYSIVGGILL